MTRKEYVQPATLILLLQPQCILGTSGKITTSGDYAEVEPSEEEYNDVFNSRRRNVWDDEEEEDS